MAKLIYASNMSLDGLHRGRTRRLRLAPLDDDVLVFITKLMRSGRHLPLSGGACTRRWRCGRPAPTGRAVGPCGRLRERLEGGDEPPGQARCTAPAVVLRWR